MKKKSPLNKIMNVKPLLSYKDKQKKLREEIYKKILKRCVNQIKSINLCSNKSEILFEIPQNDNLLTSYDPNECIDYFKHQLNSFKIIEINKGIKKYLHISWDIKKELQKYTSTITYNENKLLSGTSIRAELIKLQNKKNQFT
jgi:hypothetical protein